MAIKQDSIFTPGKITLTMKMTDSIYIERCYQFKITIFMAGMLVREQSLPATQNEPVVFELEFPEVQTKVNGRCQCELFIDEQFIRAEEKPITFWPPIAPYSYKAFENRTIWTYDTSGRLNEIFERMEIGFTDATFQAVRDFGKPDIVFIGQQLEPDNISVITDRISSFKLKPILIWLRQKKLPNNSIIEIPTENNIPAKIKYETESPFLYGLNAYDIRRMADNSPYMKIKNENIFIESLVTEITKDDRYTLSYLCETQEKSGIYSIYCQLPVIDKDDPRSILLLNNLLKYVEKKITTPGYK